MNDKYSLAKCAQYGRRLAARLCDQHFGSQPDATLDGPAVLKFTPVRQLNLLVVRQLLGQWQAETARLRSAYFNFEAEPVQSALTQFMNVLSRHICLGRAALEPLLARATADTLGLVADPLGSFQRLLLGAAETPTMNSLRDAVRYIDIDKAFYQGFLDSLSANNSLSHEFLTHRFELYHAANYRAHQSMQRLVEELSALLPLTTADLLEDGPVSSLNVSQPEPAATPPPRRPEAGSSCTACCRSDALVCSRPSFSACHPGNGSTGRCFCGCSRSTATRYRPKLHSTARKAKSWPGRRTCAGRYAPRYNGTRFVG